MRLLILAYNPKYVDIEHLEEMRNIIYNNFKCEVHYIPHNDSDADPIYCVQFADSLTK